MNKLFSTIILICLMLTACEQAVENTGYEPDKTPLTSDKMTPEVLWRFGRVSGEQVSPDQSKVLYAVSYCDIKENKSFKDWYIYDLVTKITTRITNTKENEAEAKWYPDGSRIGFIGNGANNEPQLWEMLPDGSERKQISHIEGGISDFCYSPQGNKILFVKTVKLDQSVTDLHPDLPKANARIETDIMYRHWDSWHDYTYNHLFVAKYSQLGINEATDIMPGERFDSPMKPFGGLEQIAWSPDEKLIAYTCKKMVGKAYAESTNSEIWIYNFEDSSTRNFTEGILGYDQNPVFSPDGTILAWESMERDGYEADQLRLMVANINGGERTNLFADFEESASCITWSNDGNDIYFITDTKGTRELFCININTKEIKQITTEKCDYQSIQWVNGKLLTRRQSLSQPDELYLVDVVTGTVEAITAVNQPLLNQLTMGKVEERWVKTSDGKDMLVWVVLPPHFDSAKKYPTLLYCQGGPQSAVSQFWSYRWNLQMMAANDYIVVAPNRRGLQGFGKEWLEQISKDYGGQNIKDYLSAIDEVAKEPWVDKDKLGAVGASYGGYSIFYLAGNHDKRFKAFLSHCGIFNFEAMYTTTEEMWFVNWDYGGAYWDKSNAAAQRSYTFSPHKYVEKWDTPIMVVHGENDFRIPYTQGMAAYNAAILRGIPAKFLFFHDECHWVTKPQDGILWQREFFSWFDQWLK